MAKPELKPCPFCGPDDLAIVGGDAGRASWVDCNRCDCEGPPNPGKAAAINAWNTRVNEENTNDR